MGTTQRLFKKNLALLHKHHSRLALQLNWIDVTDLSFCQTKKHELNLQRSYQNQNYFYHSPKGAVEEAAKWAKQLKLENTTVLVVYGIGLGYYYENILPWLKKNKQYRVLFFEEDPAVIYRLCETALGSKILKDKQVQIFFLPDFLQNENLWNEISWTYIDDQLHFSCLKLYHTINLEAFENFKHRFLHEIMQKQAFVDEYLDYGIVFFRNFYPNLLELPFAYLGSALFQQFHGVPAIICGAGPSLSKQFKQLHSLKDKALIFAGGSALNALVPKGIMPHFGVAIDPNEAQYKRILATKNTKIPIFYRNRLFHRALQAIDGPRLYLSGTGGYDIADWFDEQLKTTGEVLDEGHNVVNFSIDIARAMGCNPIILVGVDLALTDKQYYAENIIKNLQLTSADFSTKQSPDTEIVHRKDIYGKPTQTYWKWIAESTWISQFAKKYPEVKIINATEGGIGCEGIENLSFLEVEKKFLLEKQIKTQHLEEEVCQVPLQKITEEKVKEKLETLQNSLEQSIYLLTKLLNESQEQIQHVKNNTTFSLQSPAMVLLETEIEEEIAYRYLLNTFNQVYLCWKQRSIQEIQNKTNKPSKMQISKKLKMQCQRITFLRDVARINWELIRWTIKEMEKLAEV